ncbi:serine hydroxymethyltransferase 3, chloroplastic-like [Apium graveolens]|uniref:serine hydroxymethyltransferase 3, chloroplastic-like n=1 Tax=Apium graveolens TaxID=4045 RepID=UPI003D7A5FDC
MNPKRRVSGTSVYFEYMLYRLNKSAGLVDYDMLEKTANLFRPKLIIAVASAYPRDFDYPRMRKGGPHNRTIGGLVVCLKYAQTPEFKAYQNQEYDLMW